MTKGLSTPRRREQMAGEAGSRCSCRQSRIWIRQPIRAPSLEVVNVAGDSAAGRDRIQSAPNLRRVHAESAQQRRRRIWWPESEDLGVAGLGKPASLCAVMRALSGDRGGNPRTATRRALSHPAQAPATVGGTRISRPMKRSGHSYRYIRLVADGGCLLAGFLITGVEQVTAC